VLRTTLKNVLAHKLRLALTALAVVLGVAFMSGTFVLTDTIKHTFSSLFAQTAAGETAVVRAIAPYGRSGGPGNTADRPLTPQSLVSVIRTVPGVTAADGSVSGLVTVLNHAGKTFNSQAPTLAFSWEPDGHLSSLTIRQGRAPTAADEMTIDAATASKQHFVLGDSITVIGDNGPARYTLVGITRFGNTDNLAGATLLAFDLPTAQTLVGKPGYVNQIDVAAPGAPVTTVLDSIGQQLPKGFEVITGAQAASELANSASQNINQFNTFLLVFAGIALFVGAFLIFNTFSILVGQRTRELALLRAIGASRRQINASVLGEAFLTGLVGSIIGLAVGVALAAGLYSLLSAIGVDLPKSALQFEARTAIVGLVVGTTVTVVSAILPALRAGRIAPAAGLRDDAVEADTSLRRRAIIGAAVLFAGVVVLAAGLFASAGLLAVGIGAGVTFIGVAMLVPFIVKPMVAAIGRPIPSRSVTGHLGQENAARNPRRTAATASALMIGIALVAAIATLGQSANASFNSIFDKAVKANYILNPTSFVSPVPPAAEDAVRTVPGVVAVSGIRSAQFHLGSVGESVIGLDPVGGPQVINIQMTTGSVSALAANQLLVDSGTAKSHHFQVGQTISMGFSATGLVPVTIGGFYSANQLLGNYVVSNQLLAANVTQPQDQVIALRTTAVNPTITAGLESAIARYGNLKVETAAKFKSDQKQQLSVLLNVVYALLALSIIIALVGVVNTLALSVMERTREIGLLRAVGTQRRQLRRMIRAESVIVSLLGSLLGLVLGVVLGSAVVSALSSSFVNTLAIPVPTIIVVLTSPGCSEWWPPCCRPAGPRSSTYSRPSTPCEGVRARPGEPDRRSHRLHRRSGPAHGDRDGNHSRRRTRRRRSGRRIRTKDRRHPAGAPFHRRPGRGGAGLGPLRGRRGIGTAAGSGVEGPDRERPAVGSGPVLERLPGAGDGLGPRGDRGAQGAGRPLPKSRAPG
jgi:putative ABC transport system permease protein